MMRNDNKIRTSICLIIVLLCFHLTIVHAHQRRKASNIEGVWLMANKNVKVELYKTVHENYEGRVIWMDSDANFKNFSVGGLIVDQLSYNIEDDVYESGNFYGRGHRLDCEVRMVDNDTLEILVSKGPLHSTKYCTRIKSNDDVI